MFSNKNEKTKNKTMRKKFLTQNHFVSMEATAVFDSKKKKKKSIVFLSKSIIGTQIKSSCGFC